jgi:hypothetical protein
VVNARNVNENTPLILAAMQRYNDVNTKDNKPLLEKEFCFNSEFVSTLIEAGADVNAKDKLLR